MTFFIIVIILLIALISFFINLGVRFPILALLFKIFGCIFLLGIIYGLVKMYQILGFKYATKTLIKAVVKIILWVGIFHFFAGIAQICFFLFC